MILYVFLLVLLFNAIGFWDNSAMKDTILWTLSVAMIMFINSNKANRDERYFRNIVIDNFKLTLILEFVVNIFTFSLIAEIIIVPLIVIAAVMKAIVRRKPESKQVDSILGIALGIFGSFILLFTIYKMIANFDDLASLRNLRDFLLPIVLTVTFVPFVYLMALYFRYENIFIRIDRFNKNSELAKYAKKKILTTYHFNLRKLNRWSNKTGILRFNTEEEILTSIQRCEGI